VEDDERPGQPATMKTDENMEKVRPPVRIDCRLGIRMRTEYTNVDKEMARQILT
jgi:hypothetical protein